MPRTKPHKELREIAERSTKVNAWYPHLSDGQIRGPYGRWFQCTGGDNGMGDPVKHPVPIADIYDDVEFAAAAMNNLVPLLDEIEAMESKIADLKLELILMGRDPEALK